MSRQPARWSGPPPSWFQSGLTLLGSTVLLFVLAPLLAMVLDTSAPELSQALADRELTDSIRLTLGTALAATLVCSLGGVPLAWLLARKRFPGRALLLAVIDLPVIIPHSAAGLAVLTVIGRHSLAGRVLGDSLLGTPAGIAAAMAFVSIPFLVDAAREAFEGVPERLERVARTLGASPARVFFTVSLPMAWRGILSGMVLMWARGISEFGAVVIVAYHPMTTPVLVFQRFNDYGLDRARSAAVLLVLVCVTIFVGLRLLAGRTREGARHA
ncbi:MAG: ABC transporter permease [Elusimicrobia bacterium]|nr:ABC transporter permease [Elusimicrobiota bacterium]